LIFTENAMALQLNRFSLCLAGLCLLLQSAQAAPDKKYQQQVENGWLQCLNPPGQPVAEITPSHLDEARTLLNQTVKRVLQDGGTLSADQSARLAQIQNSTLPPENARALFMQIRWLRREILLSDPHLDFEKILINRNPPGLYSHNGDQHLARHSRSGPGLTMLTDWKTVPKARAILADQLPVGATRNPDLHFDGNKVIFAFCDYSRFGDPIRATQGWANTIGAAAREGELERRYFLYEAAIDGSWVRQITGTKNDPFTTQDDRTTVIIEDNDPCYLPDGDIAFISTRSQTFGRCHSGRYNPAWVLYRCDQNGGQIHQLSIGNENEYEPSVINDGRLVFCRWEYTNRHEMFFHMLWQCRPDGTGVANYYGNDTLHPMMVVEQTAIPSTSKVVATAQGHHQYNTGTVIVIDTTHGENGEEPLTHITPETPYAESEGWPKPHYSHPYPISEHLFLVSRANHKLPGQKSPVPANDRAIYLIDDLGGREFIYEDPDFASFSPIPVRPRNRPPVLPSMISADPAEEGTVFLQNVYLTRNDPEGKIKPGDIKALRINALGVQPHAKRQACTPYVNVEIPKKVLGTVPVNPDGSACFNVPSRTPIQLQALDADGRAILTEKTFWYLQPGEKRSCVGCHEPVGTSPDMKTMAGLMKKGPAKLRPAAGPAYPGGMAFAKTVQPVLDRYCIRCHGLDKTEGDVNLLYHPATQTRRSKNAYNQLWYSRSYDELTRRGSFNLGFKPKMNKQAGNISQAFEPFYARGCSVSEMLLKNHGNVNMDAESRMRIFEWMDLNAPVNGDIFPGQNRAENRTFYPAGMEALRAEVKKKLGQKWADQPDAALVNRVFPQESRVLMAPLAEKAGGWGQLKKWESKNDPGFKKMEALVMQSFIRPANENDQGWLPTPEKGAAEPWVAADRAAYRLMIETVK
jgi:hypothetical protein